MKLELNGDLSNHSDFSNDQNSEMSSIENGSTVVTTSFISLDGLSSGVPTQTTPTLTPTTLRNIEQTFIELQNSEAEHRDQAGFVPPIVIGNNQYLSSTISSEDTELSNKSMWANSDSSGTSVIMRPTPPVTPQENASTPLPTTGRRNGGRRPNKNLNMSPEEEQRRNMRRERNKIAAARCRKRRLDHTNALLEETEGLEQKKLALQSEIEELQSAKEELQYVLERHRANCRIQQTFNAGTGRPDSPPDIKPIVYQLIESADDNLNAIRVKEEIENASTINNPLLDDDNLLFTQPANKKQLVNSNNSTLNALNTPITKPNRPSSLNVPGTLTFGTKSTSSIETIAGIPITTPSAALPFNFDSLMEGGTGLTPVSGPLIPSCSSQQRNGNSNVNANGDLITPDTSCPSKLVSL